MERYFKFDIFNTYLDWKLILTSKEITPPEPKLYNVDIDGMNGSIDLSEALSGQVVFNDRTIKCTFWTDYGTRKKRNDIITRMRLALHGKKIKIIEPDDPDHYFFGRVMITSEYNHLAYAEITVECLCEPFRYNLTDTERYVTVSTDVDIVLTNNGRKIAVPELTITGTLIYITYNNETISYTGGTTVTNNDIKLYPGNNIIHLSGNGTIKFKYKEADI